MNANRLLAAIAGLIGLFYILTSSIFVVDQRNYAVVFSFGQIVRVIEQPGLQVKLPAPFENVRFFDRRILTIDTPEAERFMSSGVLLIPVSFLSALRVMNVWHKIA
jgi:membrane protease subunit HflC